MRLVLAILLLAARPALAGPSGDCADAAAAAERASGAPAGLLGAIGRVESGRREPGSPGLAAWPWTVNARGEGRAFGTLAEAAGFVRALQADGARLIDVGCMQVDLLFHGAAFASVEQAFDPAANAEYAARFLSGLRARTGGWGAAVAAYHSSVPAEGEPYRRRVMAEWLGTEPADLSGGVAPASAGGRPDPVVVLMSAAASAVRVLRLTPDGWRAATRR